MTPQYCLRFPTLYSWERAWNLLEKRFGSRLV